MCYNIEKQKKASENMITDLHMHVVPNVDDGAIDLSMALDVLEMAYEQGVRNIFCTSHNVYTEEQIERYKANFMTLQMFAKTKFSDLNLHMGCELLCAGEYMDDVLYGLEIGVFLPLANSNFVLTELYPDASPEEAQKVVISMTEAGYIPILAHVERYPALFNENTIENLVKLGAKIQVNLNSLVETQDQEQKHRARLLIEKRQAHFIGSDAHRSDYRAPKYECGIEYLKEHCDKEYFNQLCYQNAEKLS